MCFSSFATLRRKEVEIRSNLSFATGKEELLSEESLGSSLRTSRQQASIVILNVPYHFFACNH